MTDQPNVLCISIDSLRADFTSFVAGGPATTPFLNSFSNDTTVFADAITPSIWTLPVHTSVFTGLYPLEHRVLDKNAKLGSQPTFAEVLRDAGYDTASFTRNGWFEIGDITRGFGKTTVSEDTQTPVTRVRHLIGETLGLVSDDLRSRVRKVFNETVREVHRSTFRRQQDDEAIVSNAIDAIESASDPFCHFVHLNGVHWPYTPPAPYHRHFGEWNALERFWNRLYWQRKIYFNREQSWIGSLSPPAKQVEIINDIYRGCIRATDRRIERMIESLDQQDVLGDTIVIVFADHGDSFGEQNVFGHQFSLDESLIHVPMLIYDPTDTLPKERITDPVQLNDIYPTLLSLCGEEPPSTKSVDFTTDDRREYVYVHYEHTDQLAEDSSATLDAIDETNLPPRKQVCIRRSAAEKLFWYPDEDRYDGPAWADETLRQELESHLNGLTTINSGRTDDVDDSVIQNLEDMGYL